MLVLLQLFFIAALSIACTIFMPSEVNQQLNIKYHISELLVVTSAGLLFWISNFFTGIRCSCSLFCSLEFSPSAAMSYAYLFKYIIIGDTGKCINQLCSYFHIEPFFIFFKWRKSTVLNGYIDLCKPSLRNKCWWLMICDHSVQQCVIRGLQVC